MPRPLRILVAPNSFKDGADAKTAARVLADGVTAFSRVVGTDCDVRQLPICDGGTGFALLLSEHSDGACRELSPLCADPMERLRRARYFIRGDGTALIEAAETIGLAHLRRDERNPLNTTSTGLGEMMLAAIKEGASQILLGCGDSATTDCGLGMLAALGCRFFDEDGQPLRSHCGRDLALVASIDDSASVLREYSGKITVACNLSSIATGKNSTALVYSQQKGASQEEATQLAAGVASFVAVLEKHTGRRDIGLLPGSGAAGGVGCAISAGAQNAELVYSFEPVFRELAIDQHLHWADVLISGEGLFDRNSVKGKAPVALAMRGKIHKTFCVAIVGAIEAGILSRVLRSGFDAIEPLTDRIISTEHYIRKFELLARDATTRALVRAWPQLRSLV